MLLYSVFQTFHRKNDSSKNLNPEGPLGRYLCDVTLPTLLITCQFLFCGTKKVNRIFYWVKKSNFPFFTLVYFLISCFLMFHYHSFMADSVIFFKSIFNFLLFLIVNLLHMFSRLSYYRHDSRVQFERCA